MRKTHPALRMSSVGEFETIVLFVGELLHFPLPPAVGLTLDLGREFSAGAHNA
jgi:hypothetical protein